MKWRKNSNFSTLLHLMIICTSGLFALDGKMAWSIEKAQFINLLNQAWKGNDSLAKKLDELKSKYPAQKDDFQKYALEQLILPKIKVDLFKGNTGQAISLLENTMASGVYDKPYCRKLLKVKNKISEESHPSFQSLKDPEKEEYWKKLVEEESVLSFQGLKKTFLSEFEKIKDFSQIFWIKWQSKNLPKIDFSMFYNNEFRQGPKKNGAAKSYHVAAKELIAAGFIAAYTEAYQKKLIKGISEDQFNKTKKNIEDYSQNIESAYAAQGSACKVISTYGAIVSSLIALGEKKYPSFANFLAEAILAGNVAPRPNQLDDFAGDEAKIANKFGLISKNFQSLEQAKKERIPTVRIRRGRIEHGVKVNDGHSFFAELSPDPNSPHKNELFYYVVNSNDYPKTGSLLDESKIFSITGFLRKKPECD